MNVAVALKKSIIRLGLARRSDFRGCSAEEVASVAKAQNVTLPQVYADFLHVMGRSSGRFMVGTDIHYPRLLTMKEGATAILRETCANIQLPNDACVFGMHQGYVILFFPTIQAVADPPVFCYQAGHPEIRQLDGCLSHYLHASALDDALTPLHKWYDGLCRLLMREG